MRLIIEIIAAVLLVLCIGATSAAFAAGEAARTGGSSCAFSVPQDVAGSPPPRHQEAMWRDV